jgi:hypothetical protein
MPTDLITAAGLWKKTSAKGKTYLVGRMGGVRVLVLENIRRTDKDPDYSLIFAPFDDAKRRTKATHEEPIANGGGP